MAIIYFFAGLSKMQGLSWWEGSALWGAFANLEYQSLDMTWTAGWPILVALMTQITAWWELTFAVFVWPRLLRPLVLTIAIPLHLGIAICLGMITFSALVMPYRLPGVRSGRVDPVSGRARPGQGRAGGRGQGSGRRPVGSRRQATRSRQRTAGRQPVGRVVFA